MTTEPIRTTRPPRRHFTVLATVLALLAALSATMLARAASSSAATGTVSDASFAWGLNGEQGGGAFFGGCNFLSAGTAGNTGSSRLWTQADGFYKTQVGNVTVEKPDAAGDFSQPTWATKCLDPNGVAVSSGSTTSLTHNQVEFTHGSGTVDPAANTASIHWTGSFTSVFYGGLTYWSATDPTLTVRADGSATLTATASGYGADMDDSTKWVTLDPATVTLANLRGVTVTDTGFSVTPDYLGVAVTTDPANAAQVQAGASWGSFPQDFITFQNKTGQSSYWYSSGGARDAAKPTVPLTVDYTSSTPPSDGGSSTPPSGQAVSDASFAWGLNGEQGGGAFFGGCNFLSAGTAGNTGSSRVWTQADGFYKTQVGNVTVEKPNAAGVYSQPTWATKCQDPNGTEVSSGSTTSLTKNRVEFTHGTGTVDATANTASIHWTGSFTSVFYGGLTYWSATDPTLTVNADHTATLTATASGYGASMEDSTKWVTLTPRAVTLADLHGVTVTDTGFTVTPDYLRVAVTTDPANTPQVKSGASWGSFPQNFVTFQNLTGQSSYWYSSGGTRDAAKPTVPLSVAYNGAALGGDTGGGTPPPTSGPPTLTLGQSTVNAGGRISIKATGFAANETVTVEVHSDPVTLTPLKAKQDGTVSGTETVPTSVPAGTHHLILTGQTSGITVQTTFTVTAAASCELTNGVKGGSLTWGFKKSFRSYVASGGSANSITATGGAKILSQDRAVAGNASSGTFLWPFKSSSAFTSASSFTVQYGGKVEFKYPSHFFDIWIANPKVVVNGNTGVLYADVSLTVTATGQPPETTAHTAEQLATIDLTGTSPVSNASAVTRLLHTKIADVDSFSFDGNAFYTKGQALDDATIMLSGCTGTTDPNGGGTGPNGGTDPNGSGLDNDPNLVPNLQYRPDAAGVTGLASTGANLSEPLVLAVVLLLAGAGLIVTGRNRRRRSAPATVGSASPHSTSAASAPPATPRTRRRSGIFQKGTQA